MVDEKAVPVQFGRRRFLVLGAGSGAALAIGAGGGNAAAAGATTTVWKLSADWGYAVPPKNRTRCRCSACKDHATNTLFATQTDALAARIHPCCVCQPFGVALLTADAAALFPTSTTTLDLRAADNRIAFEAPQQPEPLPESSSDPVTVPVVPPPADPVATDTVSSSDDISANTGTDPAYAVLAAPTSPSSAARVTMPTAIIPSAATMTTSLPVTGASVAPALTAAALLTGLGVMAVAVAAAHRADPVAEDTTH
jgi:hypothetical protein